MNLFQWPPVEAAPGVNEIVNHWCQHVVPLHQRRVVVFGRIASRDDERGLIFPWRRPQVLGAPEDTTGIFEFHFVGTRAPPPPHEPSRLPQS